jgi:hypothetical protein
MMDAHAREVGSAVAFSADGRLAAFVDATDGDGTIRIIDRATGAFVRHLDAHVVKRKSALRARLEAALGTKLDDERRRQVEEQLSDLVESDRRRLEDGLRQQEERLGLAVRGNPSSLAFGPRGATLLAAFEGRVVGLSVADGSVLFVLGALAPQEEKKALTFSVRTPDGYIDYFGDEARSSLVCRFGVESLQLELCQERFVVPGLLAKILAGDFSFREP